MFSRILWGVGSALVFATAYTIAADVSDGTSRGTSMGLVRGGVLFGAPTGLVVGGIVSEVAGGSTFAGFLVLAYADSLVALTVACICIGAGQGGVSGPLMALLGDLTPEHRMGRAVGTNNLLGDLGGGIGPVIALPLVDAIGFRPVFVASALLALVAAAVLLGGVYRETGELMPSVQLPEL